jgi:hypothetical protein
MIFLYILFFIPFYFNRIKIYIHLEFTKNIIYNFLEFIILN